MKASNAALRACLYLSLKLMHNKSNASINTPSVTGPKNSKKRLQYNTAHTTTTNNNVNNTVCRISEDLCTISLPNKKVRSQSYARKTHNSAAATQSFLSKRIRKQGECVFTIKTHTRSDKVLTLCCTNILS